MPYYEDDGKDADADSVAEWEAMIKPFFPNDFNMAVMAVRNKLPYGIPDWLVESTTASFFSMIAYEQANKLRKHMMVEAKNDPFGLWTVEEVNFKTKKVKPTIFELYDTYNNPN